MAAHDKKIISGDESVDQLSSKRPNDERAEGAMLKQSKDDAASFKKMRQHADALDRVLTEKGDPEFDWASG